MKIFKLVAIVCIALVVWVGSVKAQTSPATRAQNKVVRLTTELSLTPTQVTQVTQILTVYFTESQAASSSGNGGPAAQKRDAALQLVLSPTQWQALLTFRSRVGRLL